MNDLHFINKSKLKDKFATVPNSIIQNFSLSLDARGMLIYLLSLPSTWRLNITDLCKKNNIGKDKCYKIIKQLIDFKYIIRKQSRQKSGKIINYDYFIFDTPQMQEIQLLPEKPYPENPYTENQDTYKRNNNIKTHNINMSKKKPKLMNEYTEDFEEFWKLWRKKKKKFDAFKSFQIALKLISFDLLIKKVKQWNIEEQKTDIQFIPHANVWLNAKRWEDEYNHVEETPSEIQILKSRIAKVKIVSGYELSKEDKLKAIKYGLLKNEKNKINSN